jgi:hypothetical protein
MRIFVKLFLLGLLIILTVDLVGRLDNNIYKKKANIDANIIRVKNSIQFDSLDILFLGSSRMFGGIIPAMFDTVGLRTYNLGIATAGPYYIKMIWEDYCLSHQYLPKKIAIDISLQMFTSYPLTDNFVDYSIHRYLNNTLTNEYVSLNFNNSFPVYIQLKYKSFLKGLSQIFNKVDSVNTNKVLVWQLRSKGYIPLFDVINDSIAKKDSMGLVTDNLRYDAKGEEYFIRLIEEIQNKNIPIFLLEIPTKRKNYFSENFIKSYESLIRRLIKLNKVKYVKNEETFPDSLFANPGHLNNNGAEIYTKWLIQRLIN